METAKILRQLWRHRIYVSMIAGLAIALGVSITCRVGFPPESRQYEVGVANARLLVDTPQSQFVDVAPKGAETLGQRANVLATLMTDGDAKAAIATRAGLAPDRLLAASESSTEPQVPFSKLEGRDVFSLRTKAAEDADGSPLPIIEITAQAPTPAGATRLINATLGGLKAYLDSKALGAAINDSRRLQVSELGVTPGRPDVRGPGVLIGGIVGLLAFLAGCGAILTVAALRRGWAEAEASELADAQSAAAPPAQDDHDAVMSRSVAVQTPADRSMAPPSAARMLPSAGARR